MIQIDNNGVYIPQIDGKDLWLSNYSREDCDGYSLIDKNGNPNLKRYKATFDYSLDLIKLREIYHKVYRNNRFSYIENGGTQDKEYCNRIINVTFEYSVKEYNRTGDDIYLHFDVPYTEIEKNINDCIGRKNNEIVAVKVNSEVKTFVDEKELPKYFIIDKENKVYRIKSNVNTIKNVSAVRNELYNKGFNCNGIHYIRWKRSSGSARVGKCLFIDEKLYSRIHKWEMCGLDYKENDKVDLAGLEAYISLTSSSIIDTIHIEPKNILVIDDYESAFYEDVINVTEVNGELQAAPENTKISNSIFDGESLMDISLFGDYQNKGMLLLRNRFFKSCCFNTNIQRWFKDNNITSISQLNGKTLAENISDVKLITTPSSIKYLKYASLEKWLSLLESNFGVVKYEKPTHFLDGKLVQSHYQLINTIQLSYDEVNELLKPTFDFMTLIKNNPAVLRYWIKFRIEDEIEITPVKSKTDVIYKMMSVNDDFYKTKLYYDFKTDFLKSFTKDLKCGHVLINGNYSTLCGNPIEMLMHSIGTFKGVGVVEPHCFFSKRFEWDRDILASRSPHPAISNVILVKNRYNKLIDKYMNATTEIVYVNSINENLLQQAAGCDYDSDSVLLTDNNVLINAAKRNNGKFKVAVCNVSGTKKQRRLNSSDKADLDIRTSNNLIGDIINLAQELNTEIWDKIYHGASLDDIMPLYLDTCKLSILSGIEIDKAKKEFIINSAKELEKIRAARRDNKVDGKSIKPKFFAHVAKQKGYYNPEKKAYIKHHTAMDYLQQCVNSYRIKRDGKIGKNDFIKFSDVINQNGFEYSNVYDKQLNRVIESVEQLNKYIKLIYQKKYLTNQEKFKEASEARQNFICNLGEEKFNKDTMIALLKTIEKPENKNYYRLLFYTLFGYPNSSFYNVIIESKQKKLSLTKNGSGNISIYNVKFSITENVMSLY